MPASLASQLKKRGQRVWPGCIPGIEMVTYHPQKTPKDAEWKNPFGDKKVLLCGQGAELVLSMFPMKPGGLLESTALAPKVNAYAFTVVDHYKSKLYEFDSKYMFIPFEQAQRLAGLDRTTTYRGVEVPPRAHQILVRLEDYQQAKDTIEDFYRIWQALRKERPALRLSVLTIQTWEQRQATILGVLEMERTLMVMVVGLAVLVASFLIGAMLSMIVKEKTRDIGILKSLGASNFGVAQIFLLYGLIVSTVGSLLGLLAGLVITWNIDAIEKQLSKWVGREIFPREVYYFDHVPSDVDPFYTAAVVIGAILIAVLCSVAAAYRAARLQPVEALRYE